MKFWERFDLSIIRFESISFFILIKTFFKSLSQRNIEVQMKVIIYLNKSYVVLYFW